MDEFELIRRYFDRQQDSQDIRIGIGDDGAVLVPPVGSEIVNVIDTLVSGVHFPCDLDAADIGYRAVAVNLSDIAAMGSRPRWMTLALTLVDADPAWLSEFSRGMFEAADQFGVALVGGDTTQGSQLVVTVQLTGTVMPGAAITRSGAVDGDLIFVTGTPGDAAAGLQLLKHHSVQCDDRNALIGRFRRPDPRVVFAGLIASMASAAIDISDGLYGDLQKMLKASGVAGTLELAALPLSSAMQNLFERDAAIDFALGGGDDYELCFTAEPAVESQLMETAATIGLRMSRVGQVSSGAGLVCRDGGHVIAYQHDGYRHFEETVGA